ncbi:MAG: ATP-binding protein, partial [Verrucomicrobiia bacterium]
LEQSLSPASLQTFGIDLVIVLNPEGTPQFTILPPNQTPEPPAWLHTLTEFASPSGQRIFFSRHGHDLIEFCIEPVHPQADLDRSGPPFGWLVVGRVWDQAQLAGIQALPFAAPTILPPDLPLPAPSPEEALMVGVIPLPSPDGNPAAFLVAQTTSPLFLSLQNATRFQAQSLTVFGSVLFLVLLLSLQFWIVSPLHRLIRAVQNHSAEGLAPLLTQQSEFGVLARLLANHFTQAQALTQEMTARLAAQEKIIGLNHEKELIAREIHDNVIQSLYGIGLRLAWAKKAFQHHPDHARASIEGTIGDVEQAMHNLRLFLNSIGDKPGPSDHTWQAIRNILTRMRETGLLDVEASIDRDALASLSPAQGFHLIRIINEACSNVLKHADASELRIDFRATPESYHLTVADDGCGIAPGRESGYGLENMRRRAEELRGSFHLQSTPGQGTRITVNLPRNPDL